MSTTNQRIKAINPISPPHELLARLPISSAAEQVVNTARESISNILHRRDKRLLVVVGPCSIHDPVAAMDYGRKLQALRVRYKNQLEIVMRVYFEKPRTTIGWKGLINDPDLNGSFNVDRGLGMARELLLQLNQMELPAACEFLDAVTGQYYADLVSWGAIGARTTESQIHRELASGLSCPVGFKNGTNGNLDIAADAVVAAKAEHVFLSPTEQGSTALFTTTGNHDAHVILRGGVEPNYDASSVDAAAKLLRTRNISTGLMIDMSHANCERQYTRQINVGQSIAAQISAGSADIVGCMIESNLVEGCQPITAPDQLVYGQSITDACLGFEQTEQVVSMLAEAIEARC